MSMWEPFTEEARNAMVAAQEIAQEHGEDFIDPNHLFFAVARDKKIAEMLSNLDAGPERVAAAARTILPDAREKASAEMTFTPEAKRVIELAFMYSRNLDTRFIGSEHLMLGFLALGKSNNVLLRALAIDVKKFEELLVESLASQPKATAARQPHTEHPSFANVYERILQKQSRERTDPWTNLQVAVLQKDLDGVLASALAAAAQERLTPDEVLGRVARFTR